MFACACPPFHLLAQLGGEERTEAVQKAKLRDAVCLPSDISLPAAEMAMVGRCIPPPPPCYGMQPE